MIKTILAILIFSLSIPVYSHEEAKFIKTYLEDLDNNLELSSYFVERPQFIFGHHIHIPDSSAQASDYVRDLQKRLREQAYAESVVESIKVLANIEDYTLITLSLNRLKADGTLLDKVCSTYGIVHLKFGYKILSWQPSEPNKKSEC